MNGKHTRSKSTARFITEYVETIEKKKHAEQEFKTWGDRFDTKDRLVQGIDVGQTIVGIEDIDRVLSQGGEKTNDQFEGKGGHS